MGVKIGPFKLVWPWSEEANGSKSKREEKTVNIFFGFFFVVNFCLGTGFLGVPYSFFYSGYLAAVPTLLFVSGMSWINANYLIEVMARAQALEYLDKSEQPSSDSDTTDTDNDQAHSNSSFLLTSSRAAAATISHPKFEITTRRKFEISELCQIFVHRYLKYAYLVLLSIYSFLAAWSFSTVAGSAWAVDIPFRNFGGIEKCKQDAFLHNALPSDGCLYAYYFCLFLFALIVVTLSLFDLKEQAFVQLGLGVMRFVTVGIIIVYCIVRLAEGGDACRDELHMGAGNASSPPPKVNVPMTFSLVRFDPRGWVLAIPLFTYAFLFHTGISALTHPIRQKRYLHWLLLAMFLAALVCYMSLGVVVPLWFRASIQETCTLNWAIFTRSDHSLPLRVLSYYIILFPSLDVVSAFPLVIHVIVNNLYILITGNDTSQRPKYRFNRYDWFLRLALRFVVALLPILAAFGVANLVYVLKYAGLFAFLCFFFPFLLQLRSIHVCKKRFARFSKCHVSMSGSHPSLSNGNEKSDKPEEKEDGGSGGGRGSLSPRLEKEQQLLMANSKEERSLYMTPYSYLLFSTPISVWVVGLLGVVLFVFAFSSLFVHPDRLSCHGLVEKGQGFWEGWLPANQES